MIPLVISTTMSVIVAARRTLEENALKMNDFLTKSAHVKTNVLGGLDYLAVFGNGIAGLYTCRTTKLIPWANIVRVHEPGKQARSPDSDMEVMCCDVLPQMNHWLRDASGKYRCVCNGCRFRSGGTLSHTKVISYKPPPEVISKP